MTTDDPHRDCKLQYASAPLESAKLVVLAAHGRYGSAGDILRVADQVDAQDVAWIAPDAVRGSWLAASFLAPLARNEPGLSSALARFLAVLDDLSGMGIGPERIVLTGFSQGACLILELAARRPCPWHGIVAMSGGLIGSADTDEAPRDTLNGHVPKRFDYDGNLSSVPIHMGAHAEDPLIPIARVRHSADVLRKMGAKVTVDVSPGKMHGILQNDVSTLQKLLLT
ncbi:dienelactone hydrolase family protein [Rhodobacteraceae bacterium]|nr:dienelactone hydrolase family protein [Paracoccaceae bacterium]